MSATEDAVQVDGDKLMQFVFRAVDEVGATLNAALVVMGDKLGLYQALADSDGLAPAELAERTGSAERYVREWLNAQAAGGYVEYDADSSRYTLPPEQAVALTDEESPAYLPGFFQIALGSVHDSPRIAEAARSGEGIGWHDHVHDVHEGCERFFRPSYNAYLLTEWLPALEGVVEKLEQGGVVADIGCGHGASTILMAQAFPASTFVGSDYHAGSMETARERAVHAGLALAGRRARVGCPGGRGADRRRRRRGRLHPLPARRRDPLQSRRRGTRVVSRAWRARSSSSRRGTRRRRCPTCWLTRTARFPTPTCW